MVVNVAYGHVWVKEPKSFGKRLIIIYNKYNKWNGYWLNQNLIINNKLFAKRKNVNRILNIWIILIREIILNKIKPHDNVYLLILKLNKKLAIKV